MEANSLLDRIKEKDRDAFVQMMHVYGKKLYSRLLSQLGDRDMADAAFKTTMVGLYDTLTASGSEDVIEALLYRYADEAGSRLLESSLERVITETANETKAAGENVQEPLQPAPEAEMEPQLAGMHTEGPEQDNEDAVESTAAECEMLSGSDDEEKKRDDTASAVGLGFGIGVGALGLGIAAVLWVILGLLMDMNIIPFIDLGYSWFNMNVLPWF